MSRYLLKFEKGDQLRYTSHLDLLRLFQRTFKRMGIELEHSKGFNPHPKMGFAQPLSLGYTSKAEYLELETKIPQSEDILIGLMNSALPYGIKILDCVLVSDNSKSAASLVRSALYKVSFPEDYPIPTDNQISRFLDQAVINVEKYSGKRKETITIDIKAMINKLSLCKDAEGVEFISAEVHAGSQSNLNPELLLKSLFDFCQLDLEKGLVKIERQEIYVEGGEELSKIHES